jgi:Annexin
VECATNRYAYFATCLRACTAGLGTRDRDLIRLIVSHCDTDLGSIKQQYRLLYQRELAEDVAVRFYFKTVSLILKC